MTDSLASALIAAHDGGPLVDGANVTNVPADMVGVYELQDQVMAGIGPSGGWKIVAGAEGDPICSPIPSNRFFADGAELRASHHRIFLGEVEVAVLLGSDLVGEVSAAEAEAAIASVNPALEMIANPFVDRDATPRNLQLGDLQSNGAVVVGPAVSNDIRTALEALPVTLIADGKIIHETDKGASFQAIVAALVWLAPRAEKRGFPLKAGDTIITGARALAPLEGGVDIEGRFGDWGTVRARCAY